MKTTKRFIITIFMGALIGGVASAWFSPGMIEWYFSPPADLALSCKPAVQWAIETYRKVIILGCMAGLLIAAIIFFVFGTRTKSVAAQPSEPFTHEKK